MGFKYMVDLRESSQIESFGFCFVHVISESMQAVSTNRLNRLRVYDSYSGTSNSRPSEIGMPLYREHCLRSITFLIVLIYTENL